MRLGQWLRLWLRALLRRERVETEMDRELGFHIERETELNVARGMTGDDARRAALVAFGGVEQTKEAVRDERRTAWLEQLVGNVRFASRRLRRAPIFAAAAVLVLALGVGATTAVFSLLNGILLEPLPYSEPSRLVRLTHIVSNAGPSTVDQSDASVMLYQSQSRAFDGIAAWRFDDGDLAPSEQGQGAVRVRGARVTANFFDVLGVRPALGRGFETGEDRPGAPRVVCLSCQIWQEPRVKTARQRLTIELPGRGAREPLERDESRRNHVVG